MKEHWFIQILMTITNRREGTIYYHTFLCSSDCSSSKKSTILKKIIKFTIELLNSIIIALLEIKTFKC